MASKLGWVATYKFPKWTGPNTNTVLKALQFAAPILSFTIHLFGGLTVNRLMGLNCNERV
jgi:hypothetical protein